MINNQAIWLPWRLKSTWLYVK